MSGILLRYGINEGLCKTSTCRHDFYVVFIVFFLLEMKECCRKKICDIESQTASEKYHMFFFCVCVATFVWIYLEFATFAEC